MGTRWSAACLAADAEALRPVIQRELDLVVAQMSHWRAESDLGRFNRQPPGEWQVLPTAFWRVLDRALAIAAATDGAYDPTMGALVDLWGFGPGHASGHRQDRPAEAEVAAARAVCGWKKLLRDEPARRIRQPGGLRLDLSAIAKGHAVDRVATALRDAGIASFLIEVGGELKGQGVKPDGQPWWVSLESPGPAIPETVVALHGLAVATSGDYRRFFEVAGQRFSHTIDPASGRPVEDDVVSVAVLHPECMMADVLSTALTVMGVEAGLVLARQHDLAARFVTRDGDVLRETMTPAFAAMLE